MRTLKYLFTLAVGLLLFTTLPQQSEAQLLKKIKKKLEKKDKKKKNGAEEPAPTPVVEEEEGLPELSGGFTWQRIDFGHPDLIGFNIATYKGKRVAFVGDRDKSHLRPPHIGTNMKKLKQLDRINVATDGKRPIAAKYFMTETAVMKYFCNAEKQGDYTSQNSRWCSNSLGGPGANQFAQRRVQQEFEEAGIMDALWNTIKTRPKATFKVSAVGLPSYSFDDKAFVFNFTNGQPGYNVKRYRYRLKKPEAEAEQFYLDHQKGFNRVQIKNQEDDRETEWIYYADASLSQEVFRYKKKEVMEVFANTRLYSREGGVPIKELPFVMNVYEEAKLEQVKGWFMEYCDYRKGPSIGFLDCEKVLPDLIDNLKSSARFQNPNSLRVKHDSGIFAQAIEQGKKVDIGADGEPYLEGELIKKRNYREGTLKIRVTMTAEQLQAELGEGKSTEYFVDDSAFKSYIDKKKKLPGLRTITPLTEMAQKDAKGYFYAYQQSNGTKDQAGFEACYIENFPKQAQAHEDVLDRDNLIRVSRKVFETCK